MVHVVPMVRRRLYGREMMCEATYSVCLVRWSGRRSSTASYVDVVHVILKRCVPLHPNLVQWLRQVPNHTMALRRQRRPYYSTFQRADFKGKTPIRRAVIDNIRKATEMLLIPSRFVFIQFRRFRFSTPPSSRESRVAVDSRRDHRVVDDGRSGRGSAFLTLINNMCKIIK